MTTKYQINDDIIIRTPIFPFNRVSNDAELLKFIENNFFLEAIYIASPILYEEIVKLKKGILNETKRDQVLNSLYRYAIRMNSRSTPFGLFSTVSIANWSKETLTPFLPNNFYRHTRIDMNLLVVLVEELEKVPEIREQLIYYPNNSIYEKNNEFRYIEYHYNSDNIKKFKMSSVAINSYLHEIYCLAKGGITITKLAERITDDNLTIDVANDLIALMIESQVLVSEFIPRLTSNDTYLNQVINIVEQITKKSDSLNVELVLQKLKKIQEKLNILDLHPENSVDIYKNIINDLYEFIPKIDHSKVFHVDGFRKSVSSVLSSYKSKISEIINVILAINKNSVKTNKNIENFRYKFIERYDSQAIPLVDALDEDFGIGYPINVLSRTNTLIEKLHFNGEKQRTIDINLNVREKWLLDVLNVIESKGSDQINLEDYIKESDLKQINTYDMPPSFCFMFRLFNDNILFESTFGTSAASMMSRFSYGNQDVKRATHQIVEKEEKLLKEGAIMVDIVHMPDNRMANVIAHPLFRKYEMPYLGGGAVNNQNTINIEDIFIKVINNKIVLFSKKLNKIIIPTKTNVHNHFNMSLPLYQFWGDLSSDYFNKDIEFHWGNINAMRTYLPRVLFKGSIIMPATWNLRTEELINLSKLNDDELLIKINGLQKTLNLPQRILFSEFDNELVVDFSDIRSIRIWLHLVKHKQIITVKEFLWGNKGEFLNQYVANISSQEIKDYSFCLNEFESSIGTSQVIQRDYSPGDKWLYYKIYCNMISFDEVLIDIISPLLTSFIKKGYIKSFFFIKYYDTDYHIRLRLELIDNSFYGEMIELFHNELQKSTKKSLIHDLQIATYQREVERYGSISMEICENYFYIDSFFCIHLLKKLEKIKKNKLKSLVGLVLINKTLEGFKFTLDDKINYVNTAKTRYQTEFNVDKNTFSSLNQNYRKDKDLVFEVLSENFAINQLDNIIDQKEIKLQPIIDSLLNLEKNNKLEVSKFQLISSLIHMTLNRFISQDERIQEYILYEYLFKYYKYQKHCLENKLEAI
ncbi:hypothetical protein EI427_16415 [Flammeovirga pectinis]|uniref:Lantibiotic dehydratase n=1 Tax=Flammeovirga pectinis TaxID=2494373 RepID=A0A3Q9FRV5_9BACT|nr:lantibiotic dehydratase [Flammeovirga pectinis]AZQ63750.1 hypothetical protein EI427_16415 [Flammeovirga pectinis]